MLSPAARWLWVLFAAGHVGWSDCLNAAQPWDRRGARDKLPPSADRHGRASVLLTSAAEVAPADLAAGLQQLGGDSAAAHRKAAAGFRPGPGDYEAAVLSDDPVAYWRLDDAAPPTASSLGAAGASLDGAVEGFPECRAEGLIRSDQGNRALFFNGVPDQVIKIPSSPLINMARAYPSRTIELWFKPAAMMHVRQVIYDEGDSEHGISISLGRKPGSSARPGNEGSLSMYAWNYGGALDEVEFGTAADDVGPATCQVFEGQEYYAALVFNGTGPSPSYSAFIRRPHGLEVEPCGLPVRLPDGAVLQGAHEAPCLAAVCGTTRFDTSHVVEQVPDEEEEHYFHGTLDEVAIYSRPLPVSALNDHLRAAL